MMHRGPRNTRLRHGHPCRTDSNSKLMSLSCQMEFRRDTAIQARVATLSPRFHLTCRFWDFGLRTSRTSSKNMAASAKVLLKLREVAEQAANCAWERGRGMYGA